MTLKELNRRVDKETRALWQARERDRDALAATLNDVQTLAERIEQAVLAGNGKKGLMARQDAIEDVLSGINERHIREDERTKTLIRLTGFMKAIFVVIGAVVMYVATLVMKFLGG